MHAPPASPASEAALPPAETDAAACENCGTVLHGRYCGTCGQDSQEPIVPVRVKLARGLSEILALDLRYPRTLSALCSPGRLPALYLTGQRVPFVPPFRLALSASLLLFVIIALRLPEATAITAEGGLAEDLSFIAHTYGSAFVLLQLLVLPVFAAVLRAVFRRAAPLYLSHLTFILYFHGAFVLTLAVLFLLSFVMEVTLVGWVGLGVLGWLIGPYLALALRRVYHAAWGRTLAGWLLVASTYLVLNALAFILVALVLLRAS